MKRSGPDKHWASVHHTESILIIQQRIVKEKNRKKQALPDSKLGKPPANPLTRNSRRDKMNNHAGMVELVDSVDLGDVASEKVSTAVIG